MKIYSYAVVLILVLISSFAVAAPANWRETKEAQAQAVLKANEHKSIYGPKVVALGNQANIALSYGQVFIPADVAREVFAIFGRKDFDGLMGLVVPGIPGDAPPTDNWGLVALFFNPIGFVRDDDAQRWDYDKLLDGQRKSIDDSNKTAAEHGLPVKELVGWVEKPVYNQHTHQLLWATESREKGKPETALSMFGAIALGREGFLTFGYVVPSSDLPQRRDWPGRILGSISFKDGKRYADFVEGTDRAAEVGLAALMAGALSKKLGLFGMLAAFLAKWGKGIVVLAAGVSAVIQWRKRK